MPWFENSAGSSPCQGAAVRSVRKKKPAARKGPPVNTLWKKTLHQVPVYVADTVADWQLFDGEAGSV